ncbi:(Fe-S)-binding protein [Methylomonas sp. MgM2]
MFDFMDMDFNVSGGMDATGGPYIPDAGECMRCGMCVSTCPTFRLFRIDEETPRRRIRSLDKLLKGETIGADERMHLDNCLQCRACEAICPSRMAYAELFDQAQAASPRRFPATAKLAFWLIERKPWLTRLLPLVELYRLSGLQKALRSSDLLRKLGLAEADALLQKPALRPMHDYYPADSARRGAVALFTGCIADPFDRDTLTAGIRLLNAIGYDVSVPPAQGCCGAIHQHNGRSAAALTEHNLALFNALEVDAVLYAASGCGAMLSEYQSDDEQAADNFRRRLQDINEFVLNRWPEQLKLLPSDRRVAVHEPCSQRNVLKNQSAVYALLEKIPGLSVAPLADNQICCGAGGSYMLTHPDNAGQLRESKRQVIRQAAADQVVSSNFGCALFLGTDVEKLMHPLAFLARQLPTDSDAF